MKPVSLFGQGIRSISDIVTRQRRVNCFYMVRPDSDRSDIVLLGSPGSYVKYTLPTSPVRGFHLVGMYLYVVAGNTMYSISPQGTTAILGFLATAQGYVSMADNGIDITVVDGSLGYTYNLSSNNLPALTVISDVNFPNGCTTIAYNGERYIVESPSSRIFTCSAQLDGTTWTPYLFATKEDYSDNILAIDSFNGVIILWGRSLSIEFWQNAGTFPFPYQKIVGATQTWGLAAQFSRAVIGNTMVFLGQSPDGGLQVLRLNGITPVRISDEDIENEIRKFPVYNDCVSLTYTVNGHSFLQMTFPTANRTFVYDSNTRVWDEAQTGLAVTARHYAELGVAYGGNNYFSDASTGNIYQFDLDTYTDNGQHILREVCTKHVRNAGNELNISELYLDMEVGTGNAGALNPQMSLNVSKDGGKNFGPDKIRSLGAVGKNKKRITFNRLGSGKDFTFRIRMTDPVKFLIAGGSATVEDNSVS